MRMLCDTPYILDEDCRICPKLHELESLFEELFQDKDTKIIIFSEWSRMLSLVRELLEKMQIKFAWHTGDVDQKKRRDEINYFKNDQHCKVFLSTDSGSVGLNLQAANVVINLDLPWNPAKLEQRIARAWRKHQRKTVRVINLISENTIEHRMIGLLNLKQVLANSVLDSGDNAEMAMPSGRKQLMDHLNQIIGHAILPANKTEASDKEKDNDRITELRDEIIARFKLRLYKLEAYQGTNGKQIVLAVIDGDISSPRQQIQNIINRLGQERRLELEVLDRATYENLENLSNNGILTFNKENSVNLYQSHIYINSQSKCEEAKKRLKVAEKHLQQTGRKQNMAAVLVENGFFDEAITPLQEVFELSLKALASFLDCKIEDNENVSVEILHDQLISKSGLAADTGNLAKTLRNTQNIAPINKETAENLLSAVQAVHNTAGTMLNKAATEYES